MRWIVLGFYFSGVVAAAYNLLAYSPIAKSVGKSMGFLEPDGITGDSYYVDLLGSVTKLTFIPGSFLSFYLLE